MKKLNLNTPVLKFLEYMKKVYDDLICNYQPVPNFQSFGFFELRLYTRTVDMDGIFIVDIFVQKFHLVRKKSIIFTYTTIFQNLLISLINRTFKKSCQGPTRGERKRSLMTSHIFWSFWPTYLNTLPYSITSLFGAILDPPTYPNMGRH